MRKPFLLDLFSGAGGCSKGYQQAGFYVRGVDNKAQKHYVGDEFVQADALEYLRRLIDSGEVREFDAAHASPPCQAHSALSNMWNARPHADLIPQTRKLLIESGLPYVIENVPGAPLAVSMLLCGTMFGLKTKCGAELQRHRLFELNWRGGLTPQCNHGWAGVVGVYGGHVRDRRRTITVTGSTPQQNVVRNKERKTYSTSDARQAMGIDWMPMSALSQAIPPAYTEFIGRQLMEHLKANAAS